MRTLTALLLLLASPAFATDVEVRVLNSADASGSMRVEVCSRAEWLKDCTLSGRAVAARGVSVVVVPGVPDGVYGIIAFHDSNDNGEVDRDFVGLPVEGVGFSRNAPLRLAGPRFEDAALQIAGPRVVVPITLHFESAR